MNRLLFLFILLQISGGLFAQEISGTVSGLGNDQKKEPLPGAAVFWQYNLQGTTADSLGNFILPLPDSIPAFLVISMIGYDSDTVLVSSAGALPGITLKGNVTLSQVDVEIKQSSTLNSNFS